MVDSFINGANEICHAITKKVTLSGREVAGTTLVDGDYTFYVYTANKNGENVEKGTKVGETTVTVKNGVTKMDTCRQSRTIVFCVNIAVLIVINARLIGRLSH